MPSVLECVSETQTNRVWPAGFGVSYGIGSTLKQTHKDLVTVTRLKPSHLLFQISTQIYLYRSTHAHAYTYIYTHHAERKDSVTQHCQKSRRDHGAS